MGVAGPSRASQFSCEHLLLSGAHQHPEVDAQSSHESVPGPCLDAQTTDIFGHRSCCDGLPLLAYRHQQTTCKQVWNQDAAPAQDMPLGKSRAPGCSRNVRCGGGRGGFNTIDMTKPVGLNSDDYNYKVGTRSGGAAAYGTMTQGSPKPGIKLPELLPLPVSLRRKSS